MGLEPPGPEQCSAKPMLRGLNLGVGERLLIATAQGPDGSWGLRGCGHLVLGLLRAARCPFPFAHHGWEKNPSSSAPGCRGLEFCGRDEQAVSAPAEVVYGRS